MRRMETPPSYAPAKKSNTGLIIGLVLGGIAICCIGGIALLFFGGMQLVRQGAPVVECMMNFAFVNDALRQYEADHEGKLPSAAKWQEELAPYVEKAIASEGGKQEGNPFKIMDPKGDWSCVSGNTRTGMVFNTEADGKTMAEVRTAETVIVFESPQHGRNLSLKYEKLGKQASPKMFGQPRGWIYIQGGRGIVMDEKRQGEFN